MPKRNNGFEDSGNTCTWRCLKKEEQYLEEGQQIICIMYLQIILWSCALGTLQRIGYKEYPLLIIVTILKLSSHWHTRHKIIDNNYFTFCDLFPKQYYVHFLAQIMSCHVTVCHYCQFPHAGVVRVKQIKEEHGSSDHEC